MKTKKYEEVTRLDEMLNDLNRVGEEFEIYPRGSKFWRTLYSILFIVLVLLAVLYAFLCVYFSVAQGVATIGGALFGIVIPAIGAKSWQADGEYQETKRASIYPGKKSDD